MCAMTKAPQHSPTRKRSTPLALRRGKKLKITHHRRGGRKLWPPNAKTLRLRMNKEIGDEWQASTRCDGKHRIEDSVHPWAGVQATTSLTPGASVGVSVFFLPTAIAYRPPCLTILKHLCYLVAPGQFRHKKSAPPVLSGGDVFSCADLTLVFWCPLILLLPRRCAIKRTVFYCPVRPLNSYTTLTNTCILTMVIAIRKKVKSDRLLAVT